jgi:hypothetical protein
VKQNKSAQRKRKCNIREYGALGNLGYYVDDNRSWQTIRDNIKTSAKKSLSYYELKYHEPCDEGYSKLLGQKKQTIVMVTRFKEPIK